MTTPMDRLLDAVEWQPCPPYECATDTGELPFATHTGELRVGDVVLRVTRLSDGTRVIDADDLETLLGVVLR